MHWGGFIMSNSEEKPSLADLLNTAIDSRLCDVHTAMPGIVKSYDRATQTAKIQPALKRKYADGRIVDLPIINKVPVKFPRSKGKWIHFDLEVGDVVTIIFSERSLDNWKEKGGLVSPDDPRKFNLSDAYAFPGGYPIGLSLSPNGGAGSIEMANGANHIVIEKDGKTTIKNGSGFIEMSASGKFKMTNNTEELVSLVSDLADACSKILTNTVYGPQAPINKSDFETLKSKIDSLKG